MTTKEPCLNGGTCHAWHPTGLDVVADVLVSARRCVWCDRQQSRPYGTVARWGVK